MERQEFRRVFDGFEAVIAITKRAAALHGKGHVARAAQKYADAAALARALDAGTDSLVVAKLQAAQMSALSELTRAPGADVVTTLRTMFSDLLPAAMAAVERRRAAGTLAAARSRPVEMLWDICMEEPGGDAHMKQLLNAYIHEVLGGDAAGGTATGHVPAGVASASMQPLGKTTYVGAAAFATARLSPPLQIRFPLAPQEARATLAFVHRAVDMVLEPRGEHSSALEAEALLLGHLKAHAQHAPTSLRAAAAAGHALAGADDTTLQLQAAWRRIQDSDVLRARGIEDLMEVRLQGARERDAAAAASAAAHGLRACALPGCAAREVHAKQFRVCAACRGAAYCEREHQQLHWPAHKPACKAARAAAAAAAAAQQQQQ
jgi:hypothetical protein